MANSFNTLQQVADEHTLDFISDLNIVKTSNTRYQKNFTESVNGWKTHSTVEIALPINYIVHAGPSISSYDDINERTINLTLDQDYNVNCAITLREQTLDSHDYNFYVKPMAENLANHVENWYGDLVGESLYHTVGTAGSTISSIQTLADVNTKAAELGISANLLCLDENNYGSFIGQTNIQNNNDVSLSRGINKRYQLGSLYNLDIYHSINTRKQTAGVGDGTSTPANGEVAAGAVDEGSPITSGSVIHIDGLTDTTTPFKKGDKITVAGVYSVHGKSLASTGKLMQFTVTADVTLSGATEADVSVSPAIVSSATSPYKNVSNSIADGSAITLATANTGAGSSVLVPYSISFCYDPRALIFAAPPLVKPTGGGVVSGRGMNPDTKISTLIQTGYSIDDRKDKTRDDIIYGGRIYAPMVIGVLGA